MIHVLALLASVSWAATNGFGPLTTKGAQSTMSLQVQEAKDAGRQVYIASAAVVSGVTTEAVISLSSSSNLSGNGVAATSLTVPVGKTLRIQAISAAWRNTAASSNSALVRLRAASTGACTVSSPVLWTVAVSSTPAALGATSGPPSASSWADGIELSGANTFCVSHVEVNTTAGLDVQVLGFTY